MSINGPQKTGLQPQQRLEIRAGMTVEDVKKYGSDGQKLAANLFDFDHKKGYDGNWYKDGVFDEKEAAVFNRFNFTLDKGAFRMYDRKTGHVTEFKFTNIDDLKKAFNKGYSQAGTLMRVFFEKDGKIDLSYSHINMEEGGKTTIDVDKKTVEVDGVKASMVSGRGAKMSVKNSDLEKISSGAGELEVSGTKDKGLLWDSSTKVYASGKNTKLNISSDSDVEIERKK